MYKKNIISFLVLALISIFGAVFIFTQIQSNFVGKTSNITLTDIEKQTVVYKDKQNQISNVNTEIEKAKNEIKFSESQKLFVEKSLTNLEQENKNLQKQNLESISSNNIVSAIQKSDLELKIKTNLTKQEELKLQKTEIEKTLNQSKTNLETLDQDLNSKKNELIGQLNSIVNAGLLVFSNYAIYLIILLILWLLYKFAVRLINKDVHHETIRSASRKTVKVIWIVLSIGVIFYGFAGQFSYILASLGFVSAALVFALQNFVASFFVFVILSITNIIKEGDIVKIGPAFEGYTGKVMRIGRFYTFIKEISPDNQEELGRTVSIPNSFLLTHPITNFTAKNRIIWQTLKVIVKGESDQVVAKKILQEILVAKFEWVKGFQKEYLDEKAELEELTPILSMALDDRGVAYTLHFPVHFEKYNEIYDQLLTEIIAKFKESDIVIAFT